MNELKNTLIQVLDEYKSLEISKQIDYDKFYLYSLITHSTAIEGSTVTEVENQFLFDEGISAKNRSMVEQLMNHLQFEYGLIPTKVNKDDKADYIQALIDSREQESLDPFRKFMLSEHIKNLQREIANYKQSANIDPIKTAGDPIKLRLLEAIREDGSRNYAQFGKALGVSEATIKRRLNELKAEGVIKREGSNKTGYWKIIRK